MLRKIVSALILVPLALVLLVFAVANRQLTTVSFDPLGDPDPALSVTLPLFAVLIAVAILGVMFGSMATWLRQGRWRRAARDAETEARDLRQRVATLETDLREAQRPVLDGTQDGIEQPRDRGGLLRLPAA